MLEKYIALFKAHERAIIIVLVLSFGAHMYGRWIDLESSKKDAQVVALTQTVAQDKQSAASLAISSAQAQAAFQTTLDAINKQNTALEASMASDWGRLAQQQKVDKALPLPAVAQRIEALVPAVGAQGIATTTDGVVMSDDASHSVLNVLEQVPVLQTELAGETQLAKNDADALGKCQVLAADQTNQIAAASKESADLVAKDKADVAAEKIKTKKAFVKGLKFGFVAGFAAGAWLVHAL